MEIIRKLHETYSVTYNEIAVITPYRAQKELVLQMMHTEGFDRSNQPSVVTIMESQGTDSS